MNWSLIPVSLVIVCTPLSLALLGLWVIYAGALFTYGTAKMLMEGYDAVFVSYRFHHALDIACMLIGTWGGLIGWFSLFALAVVSQRPWSRIPKTIKIGCWVGALSAVTIPAAAGLALPPILLCASFFWLAMVREVRPSHQADEG